MCPQVTPEGPSPEVLEVGERERCISAMVNKPSLSGVGYSVGLVSGSHFKTSFYGTTIQYSWLQIEGWTYLLLSGAVLFASDIVVSSHTFLFPMIMCSSPLNHTCLPFPQVLYSKVILIKSCTLFRFMTPDFLVLSFYCSYFGCSYLVPVTVLFSCDCLSHECTPYFFCVLVMTQIVTHSYFPSHPESLEYLHTLTFLIPYYFLMFHIPTFSA